MPEAEISSGPPTRRFLAILAADVVGYSRLTEVDEEGTHLRLRALRVRTLDPCLVSYRGRIVKNTGDGFLSTFDSPKDAVRCAIELQREIAEAEAQQPPDRRIIFRIGINIGQAIVESDDVYGVDVNVAARLEENAPPGGILVSQEVLAQLGPKSEVQAEDLGLLRFKNMSRPVRGYSVLVPGVERVSLSGLTRARGRARVPSIAVLPFVTRGPNADETYFGAGFVEDIIFALQSIRGLLVIARTSTLAFREKDVEMRQVGQELGVRYVLSGSVRRADRGLRVTAELTDVEDGTVLWADQYDGDLGELFEFQDRIATRIVWSVAPRVRAAEIRRATRKRPGNINAYDLVMQAIDLMYRMNFSDFNRAGELLRQAIAADSTYATAYAYAALWHIHNVAQGWGAEGSVDASEAARLAGAGVAIDPSDGFALAIYGHTKALLYREYGAAKGIFEQALSASPSNAMAWSLSSGVYSYVEEGVAAVARAERGLRLSPADCQAFFYLMFLGQAHYANGNYDEAIIWASKTVTLNGRLCANLRVLAAASAAVGDAEQARFATEALLDVQPRFRLTQYAQRCPYHPRLRTRFVDQLRAAGLPD